MNESQHSFVFIGGMPRSGTSPLYKVMDTHPKISRLTNTNAPEDEGQFVQDIYPTDLELGGPCHFGLHPNAHLTEDSPLLKGARERLFRSWSPYWDLSKPVLCEKSPTNTLRSRFLQAAFPEASFIFVSRHPVAYALAVRRWNMNHRLPLAPIIRNWIACYRYLAEDMPLLKKCLVIRYDDFAANPVAGARKIEDFLGLEPGIDTSTIRDGLNNRYFPIWRDRTYRNGTSAVRNMIKRIWTEAETRYIEKRYENEINQFGYSFHETHTS